MSRVLPPTCPPPASSTFEAAALPPAGAAHPLAATSGAVESRQSWEPLHATDRYRYALVYDDRSRNEVQPQPPAR